MKKNITIPRGIEVSWNPDIKKSVIIQVPGTNLKIIGQENENNLWSFYLMNKTGEIRKAIENNLTEKEASIFITYLIQNDNQKEFKNNEFKPVIKTYKLIIKNIKSKTKLN